jgi:hypothetical protein
MRVFLLSAVVLVLPAHVFAQTPTGRTEITALAGASLLEATTDGSGPTSPVPLEPGERRSIGGSVLIGLRAARPFGERARVGVSFAVSPSHELTSESPVPCEAPVCPDPPPTTTDRRGLVAYHYGVAGAYDLRRGRVRPFLGLAVGGVSYAASGDVNTDLAFTVEGGITVYSGRVGFQLRLGDEIVPGHFLTGRTEHDVQLTAGVTIRLPWRAP